MHPPSLASRCAAALLALSTLLASGPALAQAPATLGGSVVSQAALVSARVELADRAGTVVASAPVAAGGEFRVEAVPAGTYRLAVTTPEGSFAVGSTVTLAPGALRNVQIALKQQGEGGGSGSDDFWSTRWGKVTGIAILVGGVIAVAQLVDDDGGEPAPASPSQPLD